MGVARWTFSREGETLENTSLLAHSPYYQEWRRAVQGVFDEVSRQTQSLASQSAENGKHRLVLIVLPRSLPVKAEGVWDEWSGQGRQLTLQAIDSSAASCSEILLGGEGESILSKAANTAVLVACFGMRNKPKPFTSIAILEDQEHTSPLPDTADPAGSAVDAQILARYVWLAASRYEEYKDALCLCVADAIPAIFAIAPAGHNLFKEQEPMTVERVRQIAREWMS